MMTGHYRMHRGWLDHEALGQDDEPYCKRAAWAWLIENATFDVKLVRVAGKTVVLRRGQLCHSLRFLGKAWGWGHERVRRFLAGLTERDMIETAIETGQTVITICNYDLYQAPENPARRQKRRERDRSETIDIEAKEGKESKNLSQSAREESASRVRPRETPPPQAPAETPQPAAARETPDTAGLAGLDSKISEEEVAAAAAERKAAGLPEIDLWEEARKLHRRWETDGFPRNRRKAWIKWALIARLDANNRPRPKPDEPPPEGAPPLDPEFMAELEELMRRNGAGDAEIEVLRAENRAQQAKYARVAA